MLSLQQQKAVHYNNFPPSVTQNKGTREKTLQNLLNKMTGSGSQDVKINVSFTFLINYQSFILRFHLCVCQKETHYVTLKASFIHSVFFGIFRK